MYNEVIKKMRDIQIEMLIEFDRICRENNINYQLFAGTLLGAVRHKGYIPWDDDIDVCMLRDDYNNFLKVAKEELKEKYYLEVPSDEKSLFSFVKMRKKNTEQIESYMEKRSTYNGIFIDIFQMDKVPNNKFKARLHQIRLNNLHRIRAAKINTENKSKLRNNIKKIYNYIYRKNIHYYVKKIDEVADKYNKNDEFKYVAHLTCTPSKKNYSGFIYSINDFSNEVMFEFEGRKYPGPQRYHELLTQQYGDYMTPPPKNKRFPHHGVSRLSFGKETYSIINENGKIKAIKGSELNEGN